MVESMKINNFSILLFIIFFLANTSACSKTDPDFKHDIINGPEHFQFDPHKVPIPGVTTEEELLKMYPNPSRKWTFKKPIPKEILGRKFNMDKIIFYFNFKSEKYSRPGASGYRGKDYIYFYIFIEKGVVQQHLIRHVIMQNDKWVEAEHTRLPEKRKKNENWEDQNIDGECYWAQRRDRAKFLAGSRKVNPCPYWETVPAW